LQQLESNRIGLIEEFQLTGFQNHSNNNILFIFPKRPVVLFVVLEEEKKNMAEKHGGI